MATKSGRTIEHIQKKSLKDVLMRWESLLVLIFLAVNIMNMQLSPYYLDAFNLFTNINNFLVKGFIALPMAYVLLLGDIDLSVGANVCLSATILGITYNATGSIWLAILACLAVATLCGAINGFVLTKFTELAPMIVTLATTTLYRGISERILGGESTKGMRNVAWFAQLYDARIGPVPILFLIFCAMALVFGIVMHKTVFGRQMYAIGASRKASRYAGVKVQKIRMIVFTLTGFICGVAAVFYCSWMGAVKSNIAEGYDLEAISMCVLGGISTAGGKGNFPGAIISIFIIGFLRYGLGLINLNPQIIRIIIGALLIVVVMLPNIRQSIQNSRKKKAAM